MRKILAAGFLAAVALAVSPAFAQAPEEKPAPDRPMTVEKVKEGLYLIRGPFSQCSTGGCRGASPRIAADRIMHEAGDVAVRVTTEGLIVVDDKFAWNVPELLEKVKSISPLPIKYVLNTHYHADHTGGNAAMLERGFELIVQRSLRDNIVNVRKEPAAASRIVFGDFSAIYLGGAEVQMINFGRGAHTTGDTFVYFPDLKTVHTGDVVMDGAPNIDYRGGASAIGWVDTIYDLLKLDFDTVIPGHGPLFDKEYVRQYVKKLEIMNQRMMDLIAKGVPKNQVAAQLKLDDLGWDHTDSTSAFMGSIPGYYDEMAALVAAKTKK